MASPNFHAIHIINQGIVSLSLCSSPACTLRQAGENTAQAVQGYSNAKDALIAADAACKDAVRATRYMHQRNKKRERSKSKPRLRKANAAKDSSFLAVLACSNRLKSARKDAAKEVCRNCARSKVRP